MADRVDRWIGWLEEPRPSCVSTVKRTGPIGCTRAATASSTGDFSGVEKLLSAFGGMGSFNDLWLHPRNGHTLAESEVTAANQRLDALRGGLFGVAREIKREEEAG